MPRFCKCCGLAAAQEESACGVCEAPQAAFDCPEPSLYGEPLAVVIMALLHVIRGQTTAAQQLVVTWRTKGPSGLKASDFDGLLKLTGATAFGPALAAANTAATEHRCNSHGEQMAWCGRRVLPVRHLQVRSWKNKRP